jgi:alpha-D-ribose 1-methylphosphonate 5-triphosphate synthase subunit PhnL
MNNRNGIHPCPEDEVLLSVEGLCKSFDLHLLEGMRLEVIRDISFRLTAGEFGVLAGPSGSGKSTVLKCIFGTYAATSGRIRYRQGCGQWVDLAGCQARQVIELRRREMSCVTQFLRCAPRVAAEGVVAATAVAQGVQPAKAFDEARELLGRFRIPERLWRAYPVTFSGGEQQRVNLARAFIQKPRLLLLDEPTASLDRRAVEQFLEALGEVRRSGTTCLAVFHDRRMIRELASQVIELGDPTSCPAG